ncbi:hypothetical protein [Legionella sp. WA2022007384]
MYYAYSISLMYFLRYKNNLDITTHIFDKLNLTEEQKDQLKTLLNKDLHQEFTHQEIVEIIEPILGRATRDLAAEYTKAEFLKNPESSIFCSNFKCFMEFCIKKETEKSHPEFAKLIINNFDEIGELEIFNTPALKDAMQDFVRQILPQIVQDHELQWRDKYLLLQQQNIKLSPSNLEQLRCSTLEKLLQETTNYFLQMNQNEYLNLYIEHLKTEFIWGTLEELKLLHQVVQGEHVEYNHSGVNHMVYDVEICLHIYINDQNSFCAEGVPEMIINNYDNIHWNSKIPEIVFQPKVFTEKTGNQTLEGEVYPATFFYKRNATKPELEYEEKELKNLLDILEGKPFS